MTHKTHYRTLGIDRSANDAAIRSAYLEAAKRLHPDRNPGNPEATRLMQDVQAAFACLSCPQHRAAYDQELEGRSHQRRRTSPAPTRCGDDDVESTIQYAVLDAHRMAHYFCCPNCRHTGRWDLCPSDTKCKCLCGHRFSVQVRISEHRVRAAEQLRRAARAQEFWKYPTAMINVTGGLVLVFSLVNGLLGLVFGLVNGRFGLVFGLVNGLFGLVFGLVDGLFGLVNGLFGLVFGLVNGLFGLVLGLVDGLFGLVDGLLGLVFGLVDGLFGLVDGLLGLVGL